MFVTCHIQTRVMKKIWDRTGDAPPFAREISVWYLSFRLVSHSFF